MGIDNYTFQFKKIILGAVFSTAILSGRSQTNDRVHIGILYPLSTHGFNAVADTNEFSLHLLGGVSAEEKGLAIAGFSNVVRNNLTGLSFAGFSNHIRKKARGSLFAGFINTYGEAKGMQFAGFGNVSRGKIVGAQLAGFINTAKGLQGSQFAGFSNHADSVSGTQFAGFLNSAGSTSGSQFGGFANLSQEAAGGTQIAGFLNKASDVKGSQVAGFINIARKVRGVQAAGFINIADSSDHPIGVINLIKNGEKSLALTVDETQTTILSFRSGGKVFYGVIGAGYNLKNEEEVYAFEAGFGAHFWRSKSFCVNTELIWQQIESFHPGEYYKAAIKLLPAVMLSKHVQVFAGGSLNFIGTNTSEGRQLTNRYIWSHQSRWTDNFHGLYAGYTAGLNFIF